MDVDVKLIDRSAYHYRFQLPQSGRQLLTEASLSLKSLSSFAADTKYITESLSQ